MAAVLAHTFSGADPVLAHAFSGADPVLAHAFSGPAGGVSSALYLVAAAAAFVFLEARDRRRTAEDPAKLARRVRVAGAIFVVALIAGLTATWWVPHDEPADSTAASPGVEGRGGAG